MLSSFGRVSQVNKGVERNTIKDSETYVKYDNVDNERSKKGEKISSFNDESKIIKGMLSKHTEQEIQSIKIKRHKMRLSLKRRFSLVWRRLTWWFHPFHPAIAIAYEVGSWQYHSVRIKTLLQMVGK